jgi:hypothetical protein
LHGTHPLGFTRYTELARIYRVSMLHELGANVPTQSRPLRYVPGNSRGKIAKRADCWLRSTAQVHWTPSVPVKAVTARCVGRNSQNRGQCACFAEVGWDGASWAQLSHHSTLAHARAPPSHPTVMCRVPPSGDTPRALGAWHDGAHHSQRKIRSKSWEKITSPKKL